VTYPDFVKTRLLPAAALLVCLGCLTSAVHRHFDCPDEVLTEWQIPAGLMEHELTPVQARAEVLNTNLSREGCEARWEELRKQWREGDRYWLYRRPEDNTLNSLGEQEGVVLIRGCEQLGFVTTRIATEEPPAQRR